MISLAVSARSHKLGAQIYRYVLVGVANTALGMAIIIALHAFLGLGIIAANVMGYGLCWTLAFALNRAWTFQHKGAASRAAILWFIVTLAAFCVNLVIVTSLDAFGTPYLVAQAIACAAYSILTFLGARHVVFTPGC
jgi:putative flippase GtrA